MESVKFLLISGVHAETLMTFLKVKTSRQKNLLRVHRKKSNVEILQKFESKRAIHNEDLISILIRWFCNFCVEVRVVSLYQKIQPGLSGLLYLHQKGIGLISRP